MSTNYDSGRSSLLQEQYRQEMEIIDAALREENQDEQEERLSLVEHSWPLSCACFQVQNEADIVVAPVFPAYART